MNLTAELDIGDETIWTVGQATLSSDAYIALLREYKIAAVFDVRSRPYSRWAEHFNQEALEPTLQAAGIEYWWRGDLLGQRPVGDEFYDAEGHTLYARLVAQKWFMKAIGEIEYQAGRRRVALTCLEEKPETCHRYLLLGRLLVQRGHEVLHIRKDARVQRQQDIALLRGEGQGALFGEPSEAVWRSAVPMRRGHGVAEDDDHSGYPD